MKATKPCIFLDRDGVLNQDNPQYTYRTTAFTILPGVPQALYALKEAGYLLVVVTNQSGIAQKIYTQRQMNLCHLFLQDACEHVIDHFYYCPYHPSVSQSLSRKPGTLMFEKAIAKYGVDVEQSWMVGDRTRDIIPARQLGIRTIQIGDEVDREHRADVQVNSLWEAANHILHSRKVHT
jgi:D-glycero-D-manno-heptose 1,7-bisphosphate phosphatase